MLVEWPIGITSASTQLKVIAIAGNYYGTHLWTLPKKYLPCLIGENWDHFLNRVPDKQAEIKLPPMKAAKFAKKAPLPTQ